MLLLLLPALPLVPLLLWRLPPSPMDCTSLPLAHGSRTFECIAAVTTTTNNTTAAAAGCCCRGCWKLAENWLSYQDEGGVSEWQWMQQQQQGPLAACEGLIQLGLVVQAKGGLAALLCLLLLLLLRLFHLLELLLCACRATDRDAHASAGCATGASRCCCCGCCLAS